MLVLNLIENILFYFLVFSKENPEKIKNLLIVSFNNNIGKKRGEKGSVESPRGSRSKG